MIGRLQRLQRSLLPAEDDRVRVRVRAQQRVDPGLRRVAPQIRRGITESFWSNMQRELLDRTAWDSRTQLASAMFEWVEGFYNPRRRHSSLGNLSPAAYETLHTAAEIAHDQHTTTVREAGSGSGRCRRQLVPKRLSAQTCDESNEGESEEIDPDSRPRNSGLAGRTDSARR
ncbi:integrase core domain-containing protein [Microbacterium sp.]|uniref:integrase core domain-containing protein n=1 Tax=Microbacterium sp. TaxID=51671 RepID=UPI003C78ACEC